jgi:hypothetical protein
MAVGPSTATLNSILNAIGNATAYSLTNVYVKLHLGDPGAAGTSNASTITTRMIVSFATASGASMANDADIVWTNVDITGASEDQTHISLWDNLTAGNFVWSLVLTANPLVDGDTLTIPAGSLILNGTPAS